ncbi:MAG: glycosyltransferase family 2 protein [Opitutae bacterium]|nr:glycosyltransferase family 2 protein [Opitutae bacterium]MDG1301155.1 glycosyltransferase family 2 protein [Opitutae bacterium]
MTQSPVIFIIYNRTDLTEQVFAQIRATRPKQLYIIADGPQSDSASDRTACEEARAVIQVDWECDVTLDYSEVNLGCQQRVHSGISKAFEQFDRAIILEDDCLPHPSFFSFCDAMLEHYTGADEVMHICGSNFVHPDKFSDSYAFTQYATPWGWATWKRAWQQIDLQMTDFFNHTEEIECSVQISARTFEKLTKRLRKVHTGDVCSWAYPWLATILANNGLSITPKNNLVSNIGFDERSTHTANPNSFFANNLTGEMPVDLSNPQAIEIDRLINKQVFDLFFGGAYRKRGIRAWPGKIKRALRKLRT